MNLAEALAATANEPAPWKQNTSPRRLEGDGATSRSSTSPSLSPTTDNHSAQHASNTLSLAEALAATSPMPAPKNSSFATHTTSSSNHNDGDSGSSDGLVGLGEFLSSTANVAPPINYNMSGWVWKQGGRRHSWKRRWFSMVGSRLYYQDKPDSTAINFILIGGDTVANEQQDRVPNKALKANGFYIRTAYTHRVYYLATESTSELKQWLALLRKLASQHKNRKIKHVSVSLDHVTTRTRTIPVLDVLAACLELKEAYPPNSRLFCEIQMRHFTFRSPPMLTPDADGGNIALINADCTFPHPEGDLIVRILTKGKVNYQVIGTATVNESDWTSMRPTTKTVSTAIGLLQLMLHLTPSSSSESLLFLRGIATPCVPLRLDAGDIILFSSSHLLSYGTKLFTLCEWDHVGIIIRWFNQSLRIMEATGDGVCCYDFETRMRDVLVTSKISVRRLYAERTAEFLDRMHDFMCSVKGRPFKQNWMEIARAAGNFANKEDLSSLFCSQLVAAMFQATGLLSRSRPSNQYLPKDWAEMESDEFLRDPNTPAWSLSPVMLLKFDKPVERAHSPYPSLSPVEETSPPISPRIPPTNSGPLTSSSPPLLPSRIPSPPTMNLSSSDPVNHGTSPPPSAYRTSPSPEPTGTRTSPRLEPPRAASPATVAWHSTAKSPAKPAPSVSVSTSLHIPIPDSTPPSVIALAGARQRSAAMYVASSAPAQPFVLPKPPPPEKGRVQRISAEEEGFRKSTPDLLTYLATFDEMDRVIL